MRRVAMALLLVIASGCANAAPSATEERPITAVVESGPAPTPTTAPTSEQPPTAERGDLRVDEFGYGPFAFSDGTLNASWAVIIAKPNRERWVATDVDLTVTFYDAAGTVLGSESDSTPVVLPGQKVALTGAAYEVGEVSEMRVQVRPRGWEETDESVGYFQTSGVTLRGDRSGGWTVTGSVTSFFTDDFEDVYAAAVLRDDAGNIVGGGRTYVDFVPGSGDTSVEVRVTEDLQGVASADLVLSLTILSLY